MPKPRPKSNSAKNPKPTIFVIAPLGEDGSDERKRTEGIISALKSVSNNKYNIEIAHTIREEGSITDQIVNRLVVSDVVVADLTEHNPNVFYELAARHSVGRPVIMIAKKGTSLPFDIRTDRVIFYGTDFTSAVDLANEIINRIEKGIAGDLINNPITRIVGQLVQKNEFPKNVANISGEWAYICTCHRGQVFDNGNPIHGGTVSITIETRSFGLLVKLKGKREWTKVSTASEKEYLEQVVNWESNKGSFTSNTELQYYYKYRNDDGHYIEAFSVAEISGNLEKPAKMQGEFHYLRKGIWGSLELERIS